MSSMLFYLHSSLVISFSHYVISWHNISSFIVSSERPAPTLPRCPWLVTFHPCRQSLKKRPWGHPRHQCLKKKKSPCNQVLRTGWIAQALPTTVQLILLWLPLRWFCQNPLIISIHVAQCAFICCSVISPMFHLLHFICCSVISYMC